MSGTNYTKTAKEKADLALLTMVNDLQVENAKQAEILARIAEINLGAHDMRGMAIAKQLQQWRSIT